MWDTYSGLSLCGTSSLRASSVNVMSECNIPSEQNAKSPWTEGGFNLTLEKKLYINIYTCIKNNFSCHLLFVWFKTLSLTLTKHGLPKSENEVLKKIHGLQTNGIIIFKVSLSDLFRGIWTESYHLYTSRCCLHLLSASMSKLNYTSISN
jgi:hypothetical protein